MDIQEGFKRIDRDIQALCYRLEKLEEELEIRTTCLPAFERTTLERLRSLERFCEGGDASHIPKAEREWACRIVRGHLTSSSRDIICQHNICREIMGGE